MSKPGHKPSGRNRPSQPRTTRSKFVSYDGPDEQESQTLQAALMWEMALPNSRHITTSTTKQQRKRFTSELQEPLSWKRVQEIANIVLNSRAFKLHDGQPMYAQEFYNTHMKETEETLIPPVKVKVATMVPPGQVKPTPPGIMSPEPTTPSGVAPTPAQRNITPTSVLHQTVPTLTTPAPTIPATPAPPPMDPVAQEETLQQLELHLMDRLTEEQRQFMEDSSASTAPLTIWIDMTIQERLTALQKPLQQEVQTALASTSHAMSQVSDMHHTIQSLQTLIEDMEQRTRTIQQRLDDTREDLAEAHKQSAQITAELHEANHQNASLHQELQTVRSESQRHHQHWNQQLALHLDQLREQEQHAAQQVLTHTYEAITQQLEQDYQRKCHRTLQRMDGTFISLAQDWHDDITNQYDTLEQKAQNLIESAILAFETTLTDTQERLAEDHNRQLEERLIDPAITEPAIRSIQDKLADIYSATLQDHEASLHRHHQQILADLQQQRDHQLFSNGDRTHSTSAPHAGHNTPSQQHSPSPAPAWDNIQSDTTPGIPPQDHPTPTQHHVTRSPRNNTPWPQPIPRLPKPASPISAATNSTSFFPPRSRRIT